MLNKRILCVLLAVVCLGVAGSLAAQDTGRVEGRLTRPDGAAVAGAAVAIEGVGATVTGAASAATRRSTTTTGTT